MEKASVVNSNSASMGQKGGWRSEMSSQAEHQLLAQNKQCAQILQMNIVQKYPPQILCICLKKVCSVRLEYLFHRFPTKPIFAPNNDLHKFYFDQGERMCLNKMI